MATTKIPSGTTQYDILSSGRTYVLDAGSTLTVTGSYGIFVDETIHDDTVIIRGDITQTGAGFAAIKTDGMDMTFRIEVGGSVTGTQGIFSESTETADTLNIINRGLIDAGGGYAIETQDSKEVVVNSGEIIGRIYLGSGNDVFDNRGGSVDHRIEGGAGDDTLITDNSGTKLKENGGSEGYDIVKSTVNYTLSENVEKLILFGTGNTRGTGTDDGNDLFGGAGNNKLFALDGVDTLDGGRGNDQMTGGGNFDTFFFRTGNGHDTIMDFENGVDKIGLLEWTAIENFSEVKQHLTASNGDLFITDGSDQLIIRDMLKSDLNAGDFLFPA
ncbi:MAG: hemolysin-type calcium-binding repeat family protein [Rhizobium sp.]|nr:hemolysin-type calcium-binding repeat family protein [Rhizobium sp.]